MTSADHLSSGAAVRDRLLELTGELAHLLAALFHARLELGRQVRALLVELLLAYRDHLVDAFADGAGTLRRRATALLATGEQRERESETENAFHARTFARISPQMKKARVAAGQ